MVNNDMYTMFFVQNDHTCFENNTFQVVVPVRKLCYIVVEMCTCCACYDQASNIAIEPSNFRLQPCLFEMSDDYAVEQHLTNLAAILLNSQGHCWAKTSCTIFTANIPKSIRRQHSPFIPLEQQHATLSTSHLTRHDPQATPTHAHDIPLMTPAANNICKFARAATRGHDNTLSLLGTNLQSSGSTASGVGALLGGCV